MRKYLKRMFNLKDEKGLTLIELLAVIVILGVIAAIAVPSITGITESTKREAHKANAKQMIEATKQMVAISGFKGNGTVAWAAHTITNGNGVASTTDVLTASQAATNLMVVPLSDLVTAKYFTAIKNPTSDTGAPYSTTNNVIYVKKDASGNLFYYADIDDAGARWTGPIAEGDIDKLSLN